MFARLPQDITLTVLQDWLENSLSVLSVLDVAVCNCSMRPEWLHLVGRVKIPSAATRQPIHSYLRWIHRRRILVSKFVADMHMVNALDAAQMGDLSLPSVESVEFDQEKVSTSSTGIGKFLALFPQLSVLGFENCDLLDRHLCELRHLRCPLCELHLGGIFRTELYAGITPGVVVMLVERFSSTLQLLDVLDDWALNELAKSCNGLTHLYLACDLIKVANTLVHFCANNPNLISVGFQGFSTNPVTNEVMEKISKVCRNLQHICLGYNFAVTASVVSFMFDNCPDLVVLTVHEMRLAIGGERKHCDLTLMEGAFNSTAHIGSLFNNLHFPIGRFGTHKQPIPVNKAAIHILANKFGATLTHLFLLFAEDVFSIDMYSLLRSCPLLIELAVKYAKRSAVMDDEALAILSSHCPKLEALSVINCALGVTDEGFTHALRNWAQHQALKELRLNGCCMLSDAVLPVILECLPNLKSLQLQESNFTKEGLLALAVQMIPKRLKGLAASTTEDSLWIQEALPRK